MLLRTRSRWVLAIAFLSFSSSLTSLAVIFNVPFTSYSIQVQLKRWRGTRTRLKFISPVMFPGGSEGELTVSLPEDSWFGSILRLKTGRIQGIVTPETTGYMLLSPTFGRLWDIVTLNCCTPSVKQNRKVCVRFEAPQINSLISCINDQRCEYVTSLGQKESEWGLKTFSVRVVWTMACEKLSATISLEWLTGFSRRAPLLNQRLR